ncbi:antibiotic biosynthesis monooxygenase [Oceanobacter mangrovi]|uniref:antibiotic biosynthesis monooxygenase n=1 Tax=Oceanobacter mangrovi TaxID=2862510 RepID=UPI001C8EA373|nr:antibiotic biosynthesis monooxygenase [Oceanobacter mangrovi]
MSDSLTAAPTALADSVAVQVSRSVKPGCEAEFEALCSQLTEAASQFAGYLGANLFRPGEGSPADYRIVFRFADVTALDAWEQSPQRAGILQAIEPLLAAPSQRQRLSGIALWFDLPDAPAHPTPPRYKMTLVSWLALYPIVTLVFLLFGDWLQLLPLLLRTLLVTALVIFLMTYVAMPRLTRWFRFWLFAGR